MLAHLRAFVRARPGAQSTSYWFGDHSGARMEGLLVFTEVSARRLGTRQLERLLRLLGRRPAGPADRHDRLLA